MCRREFGSGSPGETEGGGKDPLPGEVDGSVFLRAGSGLGEPLWGTTRFHHPCPVYDTGVTGFRDSEAKCPTPAPDPSAHKVPLSQSNPSTF